MKLLFSIVAVLSCITVLHKISMKAGTSMKTHDNHHCQATPHMPASHVHLMNTVIQTPGVYSCAIDSFIELCYHVIFPYLQQLHPHLTSFCQVIHAASVRYQLHTSGVPNINYVY